MNKRLNSIIWIVFLIIFGFSCSKKSDPTPSLVGSWLTTTLVSSNCTDPADNGTETCTTDCVTFTFTSTTFTAVATGVSPISGTYTISGNTITLTSGGITGTPVTFTVSSTLLTMQNIVNGCTQIITFTKVG